MSSKFYRIFALIDVEVQNIGVLIEKLYKLRLEFTTILSEAKDVASNHGVVMKSDRKNIKLQYWADS